MTQFNECFQTLTDEDVLEAMKQIPGYVDITPSDFLTIYKTAFDHALSRIRSAVLAGHVMTKKVVSITQDDPVLEAVKKMGEHNISGLPVLDRQHKIVGVISEKDFLTRMNEKQAPSFMQVLRQCLEANGCLAVPFKHLKIRDIMSSPPVTITKDATLTQVAGILDRLSINRLPVCDKTGRLVGIIARSDIVQVMC
ncbi:MAG TPA: CBS domain-containing protein [Desulfobacteraceae bacterium]|nr:CBS domain-containing protein [Desulfobacteraceae bacterium]|tara:strand:+ start:1052 stop:1639 length:588 start_codon:yes stop_codon:yes gene_type:complete